MNDSIYMENETFDKIKNQVTIIDVRSEMEYKTLDRLAHAKNIYVYDLIADPEKYLPDKNAYIVTVCNGGNRSSSAAEALREHGYKHAYVLINGIFGYKRWKK